MPRKVGNVLLNVEGRHFQVDRQLLASQSIYFRMIFRGRTKRDQYGAIIIPGSADQFSLIVDYLTGEYQLSTDQIESIIDDGASLYLIPSLVYLSQCKAQYEEKDKRRIQEVKHTMNKMQKLTQEVTKLEAYIDTLQQRNTNN